MRRALVYLICCAGIAVSAMACSPGSVAGTLAKTPSLDGSAMCRAGRTNPSPLVVEWSSSARAQFEALAKNGLIVARYDGCELQVLTQCRAPGGGYRYTAITPKNEVEQINGEDELRAKIPLGAAQLSADLRQSGQLVVDSTVVGRFAAENVDIRESALVGRCLGATHVVSGLTVGAFELSSGASSAVSGGADVLQFGGDASSKHQRKVLTRDGDARACIAPRTPQVPAEASNATAPGQPVDANGEVAQALPSPAATLGNVPPEGCGALIRIDLAPLPEAEARHAAEEKHRDEVLAERREAASTRRTVGYALAGSGLALGALASTFVVLSAGQNSKIEDGGLATSEEIQSAADTGVTYNTLGWIFGVTGGALFGVGAPLVVLSPRPERADDAFLAPKRRFAGTKR